MLQEENQTAKIENDDEISLIDLFAVLWKRKMMIIGITVAAMVAVVVYSVISLMLPPEKSYLPNEYTVYSTMLINDESDTGGIDLGGAGSLASLLGVSIPSGGSNTSSLIMYLVKSDLFLDALVKEFDIVNKYEIEKSPIANSRDAIRELVTAEFESDTGVLKFSCIVVDEIYLHPGR